MRISDWSSDVCSSDLVSRRRGAGTAWAVTLFGIDAHEARNPMSEFDLIARIRDRVPERADVLLGIGDDAALLQVPAGQVLVVSCDTLNAGVHFPLDTTPDRKSTRLNSSH